MKLPQEHIVKVGGLAWKVITTRGPRGGPVLLMLPGTLGTAAIFKDVIERCGARLRIVSVTYPQIDDIHRLADSLAALLERCGLSSIFEMAGKLDVVLLSVGSISSLTTSYRTGYITESERRSLIEAGAVGDVLYNFIDENGDLVEHEVNERVISVNLPVLRRAEERVLISGGKDKLVALRAAIKILQPTTLVTDEQTAISLLD